MPPNPMPPDTAAADLAWAMPRRMPQPLKTFEQPLRLTRRGRAPCRATTSTARAAARATCSGQFADARPTRAGWRYYEIDASHNPHITMPETLAALLHRIAMQQAPDLERPL